MFPTLFDENPQFKMLHFCLYYNAKKGKDHTYHGMAKDLFLRFPFCHLTNRKSCPF